jgi:hypothetical protein
LRILVFYLELSNFKKSLQNWAWWYIPIIPPTQEAEAGRPQLEASNLVRPCPKIKTKRAGESGIVCKTLSC